jgi:Protein of unknown function (DUF3667)
MSHEPAKFILGDTAINAGGEHPDGKRGFFGRRKRRREAPLTHCENCGAQLTGRYCAQCGQPAIDYRRSFRHVLVDILDSFLNWDSKFFATIGLCIARPWYLTNEFLAGRRVRYLNPLRLYLLASILFFFAVSYLAKSIHVDPGQPLSPEARAKIEERLKRGDLDPDKRARLEKELKRENLPPEAASKLEEALKSKDLPPEARAEVEKALKDAPPNNDNRVWQFGNDSTQPTDPVGKWLQARAKEKLGEHGSNTQLFLLALFNNLPYMMLCCIPLFAFVLKILYIRRHIFYIDHLIYALHIHTFVFVAIMLIVGATMGLTRIAPGWLAGWTIGLLWAAFAVQIFLSIRRVYRQGWFFSTFKFFVGGYIYLVVLCIALAATFLITLALP